MTFIVATNVIASRPTGTPTARAKNGFITNGTDIAEKISVVPVKGKGMYLDLRERLLVSGVVAWLTLVNISFKRVER